MSPKEKTQNGSDTQRNKVLTIVGIVMCVILIPILIINCTLIVKGFISKDKVPDFGGVMPLIVLTDSMYPDIKSGDIIICKTVDPDDVNEEDVIAFFDPAGNGTTVVTHKVIEVIEENGERYFRTEGINNNAPDKLPVPEKNLVGKYVDIRFPFAGNVAIFMQSTWGFILCIFVPMAAFIGYDMVRRKRYEKAKSDDIAALMAELESLKAAKAHKDSQNGDEDGDKGED